MKILFLLIPAFIISGCANESETKKLVRSYDGKLTITYDVKYTEQTAKYEIPALQKANIVCRSWGFNLATPKGPQVVKCKKYGVNKCEIQTIYQNYKCHSVKGFL